MPVLTKKQIKSMILKRFNTNTVCLLSRFHDKHQAALILLEEGKKRKEIAEALDCSVSSVTKAKRDAIQMGLFTADNTFTDKGVSYFFDDSGDRIAEQLTTRQRILT